MVFMIYDTVNHNVSLLATVIGGIWQGSEKGVILRRSWLPSRPLVHAGGQSLCKGEGAMWQSGVGACSKGGL